MTEVKAVAMAILREGLNDWVPIDTLIWYAKDATREFPEAFKELTVKVLEYLLAEELIAVGDIGDSGFEAWHISSEQVIQRVTAACDAVNWQPLLGLFWLSNTEKGDECVK